MAECTATDSTSLIIRAVVISRTQFSINLLGLALTVKIYVERLWRSVGYNKVYLSDWQQVKEAQTGLDEYLTFYNHERPHQSLHNKTPFEVYCNGL